MPPSDQSYQPVPPEDTPTATPPAVFHNPLAAGYDEKTTALPPLSEPPQADSPQYNQPVYPASEPIVPPAPVPSVLDLQDQIGPQPQVQTGTVRLAPVPRGNDMHAQGLATSAQGEPFGAPIAPHVAEAASLPLNTGKGNSSGNSFMYKIAFIAIALLVIGGGGLLAYKVFGSKKKPVASSSPTPTSASKRDTTQKQLPLGYVQTQTDCYTVQVPTGPDIQLNRDCRLSLTYGEKKTSTIVISPYKDFDLVGTSDSGDQSKTNTFDSRKILEGLISSTTAGRTVAERQDTKVGNIDTVKITSSSSTNGEIVAYAFIVLPVADQKFAEKNFIAFIVTGAYGDDASKTAFDHLLQSWQWQ